jgi:hypothetical protein
MPGWPSPKRTSAWYPQRLQDAAGYTLASACNDPRPCRMHGGANGIGAPRGNRNALKHGRYTAEGIARHREVAALLRACRDQLGSMRGL